MIGWMDIVLTLMVIVMGGVSLYIGFDTFDIGFLLSGTLCTVFGSYMLYEFVTYIWSTRKRND